MAVTIKSAREIECMREAGKILASVHKQIAEKLKVGMTTIEIDQIVEKTIRGYNCIPSFKDYHGYPASVCVSVNEEVVHGIPTSKRIIMDGDLVSLDIGVFHKGYHSDAARTYAIGNASEEARKLMEVTKQSFFEGIKYAKAGNHLNDISSAIQQYVDGFGYGIVRDLVGHGIGKNLHEEPEIPNFAMNRKGIKLVPGMTLAIEPMINAGRSDVVWLDDEWTVVTEDGRLSAHYENTILITEGEPEILTLEET